MKNVSTCGTFYLIVLNILPKPELVVITLANSRNSIMDSNFEYNPKQSITLFICITMFCGTDSVPSNIPYIY